jgi:hypothetical protein
MPHPAFTALGNHQMIASRARTESVWLGLLAFSIDESESHIRFGVLKRRES